MKEVSIYQIAIPLILLCSFCKPIEKFPLYFEEERNPYYYDYSSHKLSQGLLLGSLPLKVKFNKIRASKSQVEICGVLYIEDFVTVSGVCIYGTSFPLSDKVLFNPISVSDSSGFFCFKIDPNLSNIIVFTYPGTESKVLKIVLLSY